MINKINRRSLLKIIPCSLLFCLRIRTSHIISLNGKHALCGLLVPTDAIVGPVKGVKNCTKCENEWSKHWRWLIEQAPDVYL